MRPRGPHRRFERDQSNGRIEYDNDSQVSVRPARSRRGHHASCRPGDRAVDAQRAGPRRSAPIANATVTLWAASAGAQAQLALTRTEADARL
jgi:hypothetical protein